MQRKVVVRLSPSPGFATGRVDRAAFWSGGIATLNPRLLSRSTTGCLGLISGGLCCKSRRCDW